jgi:hypothetical protein
MTDTTVRVPKRLNGLTKTARDWIRYHYGVPVDLGGRVRFKGRLGTIVGFRGGYVRVHLDGDPRPGSHHPTWHMEYLTEGDQ